MNIGEKIKETRLKKNLKQSDLADKANISRVAIGNYERNERTPTVDVIEKIARALGVNPNYLMNWDELYPDAALQVKEHEMFIDYLKSIGYDVVYFSEPCQIPIEEVPDEFKEDAEGDFVEGETFSITLTYEDENLSLTEGEFHQLQDETKEFVEHQLWKIKKNQEK